MKERREGEGHQMPEGVCPESGAWAAPPLPHLPSSQCGNMEAALGGQEHVAPYSHLSRWWMLGLSSLFPFSSSLPPKAATCRLGFFFFSWHDGLWFHGYGHFWECWFESLVSLLQSCAIWFDLKKHVLFRFPSSCLPHNSLQGQWKWLWVSVHFWEICLPATGVEYTLASCPNRCPALPSGIIFGVPMTSSSVGFLACVCPEIRV